MRNLYIYSYSRLREPCQAFSEKSFLNMAEFDNEALKRAQKRYRAKPETQEKRKAYDRARKRAEYMREYRARKKLEEGNPPV